MKTLIDKKTPSQKIVSVGTTVSCMPQQKKSLSEEALWLQRVRSATHLLRSYAFNLMRDPHDAEDLFQDTLRNAWKFRHSFEEYNENSFKNWIMKIMKNHFITEYLKRKRRPKIISIEHSLYQYDDSDTPEGKIIGTIESTDFKELEQIIADSHILNGVYQAVPQKDFLYPFLLSAVLDYRYDEIAAMFQIPMGTVRSRIHRGLTLVKEFAEEHPDLLKDD